jgi:LysM repeat protein
VNQMTKKRFTLLAGVALIVLLLAGLGGATVVSAQEPTIVHIVQSGETLYSIARSYGVNMWAIARANGITDPNHIYAGQRLVIPTGQAGGIRHTGTVHVVQSGETLYSIANRYGVSMWAIARANGITNPNLIYVGQRLAIPAW